MKNLLMSAAMFLSALTFTYAFNYDYDLMDLSTELQDNSRVKINLTDVPDVVTSSFDQSDFKDATILNIYKLADAEGTKYEFDIDLESNKWAIYFDTEGMYLYKEVI